MRTLVFGVDPGINGGVAVVGGNQRTLLDAITVPTMGDESRREVDVAKLCGWIEQWRVNGAVAYIENVTAMPSIPGKDGERRGMGAASAFRFGFACGALRAAFMSRGVPIELVAPAKWKKRFGLKGGDKEGSRQLAIRRWPEFASLFARVADHQRAEAALLAAYGAEVEYGAAR